jgi:hypothetical protein
LALLHYTDSSYREDLNALVKKHIQSVVSGTPSKALATLEHDASELLASGMVTLDAKLVNLSDSKLLARLVEVWGFFWDQVLPYVEGVLLPLQSDPMFNALYRPKGHRSSSPTRGGTAGPFAKGTIDVRTLALRSFRDHIVVPMSSKLHARLSGKADLFGENAAYQLARLQQMYVSPIIPAS